MDDSRLLGRHQDGPLLHDVIARGEGAELAKVRAYGSEPVFWLMTHDWVADLGPIGMVQRVSANTPEGRRTLLERPNAFGDFSVGKGIALDALLEEVYATISSLRLGKTDDARIISTWEAQRVLARFRDFRHLYTANDIVPEFNDTMIITKISQDCDRTCLYCPDRRDGTKRLELFTRDRIGTNMALAREIELKYHGGHLDKMVELFLNGSDLLWFPPEGHQAHPSPLEIVEMGKGIFPETLKKYAFMGLPNVNRTPPGYLRLLHEAGLYSVLVGVESFHEPTSRFLGKPESTDEKMKAIGKLKEAGFKVKLIVQVGTVGEGFVADGRFYSGREGLEETARICSQLLGDSLTRSYEKNRTKVLVSEYLPLEGTPLFRLHQEGRTLSLIHI